jgi:hypothetical protein
VRLPKSQQLEWANREGRYANPATGEGPPHGPSPSLPAQGEQRRSSFFNKSRDIPDKGLVTKYGVNVHPPADRPWGIRDFVIIDPTGVLWRIGQNIDDANA